MADPGKSEPEVILVADDIPANVELLLDQLAIGLARGLRRRFLCATLLFAALLPRLIALLGLALLDLLSAGSSTRMSDLMLRAPPALMELSSEPITCTGEGH